MPPKKLQLRLPVRAGAGQVVVSEEAPAVAVDVVVLEAAVGGVAVAVMRKIVATQRSS
jgi:hypothetical protein